jgi:ribosomal protein S12 methylthiotransferase accessory factor
VEVSEVDPSSFECDVIAVVAPAGDERHLTVDTHARETGTRVVAVELGGVGGRRIDGVNAAVSGLRPDGPCFRCLRARVTANASGPADDEGEVDPPTARLAGALAGHELSGLSGTGDSRLFGAVLELPHVRRTLLPVPGCRCASSSERGTEPGHEVTTRSLEEALAAGERAVDVRLGLVREVGEAESFPVPYYLASLTDTSGFSDASAPGHAAGVATDWNPAYMKAIGEALERYSAAVYRADGFEVGPPGAVARAIPPGVFVTSEAFSDPDPRENLGWVEGERLDTGEGVRLPAEFIIFPPPDQRHRPAITTGLGLGNSTGEALLSGLYEVIERDAAMLSWYSTYDPLGLAVESEGYGTLERRIRAEDLEATALLLTQDVDVPVVACAVHRDGEWPRFAAGMSASLSPESAALGALEEAVQNFLELRGMGPEAAREEGAIAEYADRPPRIEALVDPPTTIPAASVGPDSVPEGRAELDAVLERLDGAGLTAYGARLTPRDVAELGFEAVRVLIPEAQPLFTGEPYFGARAREVPEELGFEPRLDREHHPFP